MRTTNLRILEDSHIILKKRLMADIVDTGAWEAIKNRGASFQFKQRVIKKMKGSTF